MASFPDYLKPLVDGFAEEPEPMVLRTDMESGPAKQATSASLAVVTRPMMYAADLAGYQAFKSWLKTIHYGADWFLWTDPIDGLAKQARIVGGKYRATPDKSKFYWRISLSLETWG